MSSMDELEVKADCTLHKSGNDKKAWKYLEKSLSSCSTFPDSIALAVLLHLKRDAFKQQNNKFNEIKDNITEYVKKTTQKIVNQNKLVPEEVVKKNSESVDPVNEDEDSSEDEEEIDIKNKYEKLGSSIINNMNIPYIIEHYQEFSSYRISLFALCFLSITPKCRDKQWIYVNNTLNPPSSNSNTPIPPSSANNTPIPPSSANNTPIPPSSANNTPIPPSSANNTPIPPSSTPSSPVSSDITSKKEQKEILSENNIHEKENQNSISSPVSPSIGINSHEIVSEDCDCTYELYKYLKYAWILILNNYLYLDKQNPNKTNIFYIFSLHVHVPFLPLLVQLPRLSRKYDTPQETVNLYRQFVLYIRLPIPKENPETTANDSTIPVETDIQLPSDQYLSLCIDCIQYICMNIPIELYPPFPREYVPTDKNVVIPTYPTEECIYIYNRIKEYNFTSLTDKKLFSLYRCIYLCYRQLGLYKELIQILEDIIIVLKCSPTLWYYISTIYIDMKDYKKALISLDNCYKDYVNILHSSSVSSISFPISFPLLLSAKISLLYLHRIDDAIHFCDHISRDYADISKPILIISQFYRCLCLYIQATFSPLYIRRKQLSEECQDQLESLYSTCLAETIHVPAPMLYLYAYILYEQGKYASCLEVSTKFLSLYKYYIPIYILMTQLLSTYKGCPEALQVCKIGLDLSPDNIYLLLLHAQLEEDYTPFETQFIGGITLQEFNSVFVAPSSSPCVLECLTFVFDYYIEMNSIDEARSVYDYMNKCDIKDKHTQCILWTHQSILYIQTNQIDDARKLLEKCYIYDASYIKMRHILASVYKQIAIDIIESSESIDNPIETNTKKSLAIDYLHHAETEYKYIISVNPRCSTLWTALAEIYSYLGCEEKASNAYLTALEYDEQLPVVSFHQIIMGI
ncbi:hypothetical protein WA158_003975 [Blastocystis sp. Blastoise]